MLFHVLRHINADHGILVTEHGLCQRFAQLRLAHTGGAQEQERADGPLGVFQTHTAAANGLCHGSNGFILAYHALMQRVLQAQQALALIFRQPRHGDTRPACHHGGNIVGSHTAAILLHLAVPLVPLDLHLLGVVLLNIAQLRGLFKVLCGNGLRLFTVQRGDLLLKGLQIGRGGFRLHAHLACRLVHQVDGLIRQEPVVDIAA